ncbi:DUF2784 domain-containing protein [Knoellia sp. p5-6-4]|uniref:DUF2784 domain-containing protein n=1 Tax=unclassified Knoellia TaxID=2618719 RepID=UPI0023DCD30C|nr:DUF2784 domain-containing protein [Knoellia sp. p5-6-4]MDF2145160.1 DUF2784 domain-containing protein [Knoellia sp. p5-6-4]
MGYRLLADAVMLVHFTFLAFVVAGGLLAWRWPWVIWPHVMLALWGFSTIAFSIRCPLTDVEDWARERGGREPLSGTGFIDHYLENVVYPQRYTRAIQAVAAAVVLFSWAGLAVRRRRRARLRASEPPR